MSNLHLNLRFFNLLEMRKFQFLTPKVLEFLDTWALLDSSCLCALCLLISESRMRKQPLHEPWWSQGGGSEHKGWWEHAMPLKTSAQRRQTPHLFMIHLDKSQGLYPQSVGWGCLQGTLEKKKRKWIIVNKWYNLHASWGRHWYNSLGREGTWGTGRQLRHREVENLGQSPTAS